ncbi:MAG TPA: hypothetical protein VIS96_00655 [Terrimicrobiaceae bacterium]
MRAITEVYEILSDLATKADLPNEIAELRAKIEELGAEHAREVEQLELKIKELEGTVLPGEPAKPVAANERVEKDDLPLDAQGW